MAEEVAKVVYEEQTPSEPIMKPEEPQAVESTGRSLFDLIKDNKENDEIDSDFDTKVQVSEKDDHLHQQVMEEVQVSKKIDHQHQQVIEEIQHSHSSSSSSSDEEEDNEEKKKKKKKKEKKGLTEKIKEKLQGPDVEEEKREYHEATNIPIEKVQEEYSSEPQPEEKKGFLEKIKDKLPGQQKKAHIDEVEVVSPTTVTPEVADEPNQKKGLMDKIKEKIPGYHSTNITEE